jgi:hypothetical protein
MIERHFAGPRWLAGGTSGDHCQRETKQDFKNRVISGGHWLERKVAGSA